MRIQDRHILYFFFFPSLVFLIGIVIYPTLFAVDVSFREWLFTNPEAGAPFVGLENYKIMMHDSRFWMAVSRTVYYSTASVTASFFIGFGLALLLNRKIRGRSIFRTILLIPMVMTPIIVGFGFRFMLNYELGVINYFLSTVGIARQPFLGDPGLALNSILMVDIWQWTPFMVLVLLAGLESTPVEPLEAADIDGATKWAKFRHVILPSMTPVILVALLVRTMDSMRDFDKIYLMTAGGPGTSSEVLSLYNWRMGFSWWEMGNAAAIGLFTLFLIEVVSWIYVKRIGKAVLGE